MTGVNSPLFQDVCGRMVSYIRSTQPQLEKAAQLKEKFSAYQTKIAEVVDSLVDRGIVPLQNKVALYEDLVENPERAADMLCKLSEQVGPARLGGPSTLEDLGDSRDAIERFVMDHNY